MNVWCFFCIRTSVSKATGCISSSRRQSTYFRVWIVLKWKYQVLFLSAETWLAENSKTCSCLWFFLWFQLISPKLPSGLLSPRSQWTVSSVYKVTRWALFQKMKKNPRVCILMSWNFQKCDLFWLFSLFKLIFSKKTGWISTIKISENSFKFSADLENYQGLRTFLWSPDNSIMPRIAEINGNFDICRIHLKTRLKTLFAFFLIICDDQNLCNWSKNMPVLAGRLVLINVYRVVNFSQPTLLKSPCEDRRRRVWIYHCLFYSITCLWTHFCHTFPQNWVSDDISLLISNFSNLRHIRTYPSSRKIHLLQDSCRFLARNASFWKNLY